MKRPVIAVHRTEDDLIGTAYIFVDSISAVLNINDETTIKFISGGTIDVDESADKVMKYINNAIENN